MTTAILTSWLRAVAARHTDGFNQEYFLANIVACGYSRESGLQAIARLKNNGDLAEFRPGWLKGVI